jgi:hypothetical protein
MLQFVKVKSSGVAELANASVVHPRDLGSNLSKDRKYFLNLLVSYLNSNLKYVNC